MFKLFKVVLLISLIFCLSAFSSIPANQISFELKKVGYDEGYHPAPGSYTLDLKEVIVMGGQFGGLRFEFEKTNEKGQKQGLRIKLHSIVDIGSPEKNFAVYSRWDDDAGRALLKAEAPKTPFTVTEKDFEYIGPEHDAIKGIVMKTLPGVDIWLHQEEGNREIEGGDFKWGDISFDKVKFNVKSLSTKDDRLSMTIEFEMSSHRGPTYKVYEAKGVMNISSAEYIIKHAP